jgi:hypothetical protein
MNTTNKKSGGAPRKALDQKQTKDLRCRVTESEQISINRKSLAAGYKRTSDYVRDCVMNRVHPKAIVAMPSKKFLDDSHSYFSNLNQLMRHLHTYCEVMDDGSVKLLTQRSVELRKEVRKLRAEIQGNIGHDTVMTLAINNLTLKDLDTVRETIEAKGGCNDF